MLTRIRDWTFTIPFLIAFGIALVVFDIAGRIVRPFSLRGFEYVMASLQRTLMHLFRICGTRIRVEVSPEIEEHRGYAIISNHQSMLDIALIGGILFSNYPKYVAKKELGRWIPGISLNLRHGGNAVIDREDPRQAIDAIKRMGATAAKRDVSVVIFPEGTRSRDGQLGEFKSSGSRALLASAATLPVVPAVIDGSWRLFVNGMKPVPWGSRVHIRFGDPIARSAGDAKLVADTAETWIRSTLEEWRAERVSRGRGRSTGRSLPTHGGDR